MLKVWWVAVRRWNMRKAHSSLQWFLSRSAWYTCDILLFPAAAWLPVFYWPWVECIKFAPEKTRQAFILIWRVLLYCHWMQAPGGCVCLKKECVCMFVFVCWCAGAWMACFCILSSLTACGFLKIFFEVSMFVFQCFMLYLKIADMTLYFQSENLKIFPLFLWLSRKIITDYESNISDMYLW